MGAFLTVVIELRAALRLLVVVLSLLAVGCEDRSELAVQELAALDYGFAPGEFYRSIVENDEKACRLFLTGGMAVDMRDRDGRSGVRLACENGSLEVLECLIRAGAEIDQVANDGRSPAMIASKLGKDRCLTALIDARADLTLKDAEGWGAMELAAAAGESRVLSVLVEHRVSGLDRSLALAAMDGNLRIVDQLLALGADPYWTSKDGRTVLSYAAGNGQREVVELLIQRGADSGRLDDEGRSPQDWALAGKFKELAKIFEAPSPESYEELSTLDKKIEEYLGGNNDNKQVTEGRVSEGALRLSGRVLAGFDKRGGLDMSLVDFKQSRLPIVLDWVSEEKVWFRDISNPEAKFECFIGESVGEFGYRLISTTEKSTRTHGGKGELVDSSTALIEELDGGQRYLLTIKTPTYSGSAYALMEWGSDLLEVREDDRFETEDGAKYLVVDARPSEVVFQDLQSGEVMVVGR